MPKDQMKNALLILFLVYSIQSGVLAGFSFGGKSLSAASYAKKSSSSSSTSTQSSTSAATCKLANTVSANQLKTSCTNSPLFVALNTSVTDWPDCLNWIPTAVWTDDNMCISSCGKVNGACTLDGLAIPQCGTAAKQDLCAVPMPTNVWTGFQNAYWGRSSYTNSNGQHCYARISATSQHNDEQKLLLWFSIEDLYVSPVLFANLTELIDLPICTGQQSTVCIVEIPCYEAKQCNFNPFLNWLGVAYSETWCNYMLAKFIMTLVAWIFLLLDGLVAVLDGQYGAVLLRAVDKVVRAVFNLLCRKGAKYEVLDQEEIRPQYVTWSIVVFYAVNLGLCIFLAEGQLLLYIIIVCCTR